MTTPKKERRPGEGGARQDHGENLRDGHKGRKPRFYPLYPDRLLVNIMDMKPAEGFKTVKKLLADLIGGVPTGNPIADPMIEEAEAYYDRFRMPGRLGGLTTQSKRRSSDGQATLDQPKEIEENRKEENLKTEIRRETKQPPESGSVRDSVFKSLGIGNSRGDTKEEIAGLSHEALPQWAANYCQEADPDQAVFAHKKAIKTIGPEAFRSELDSFVAEVEAGEEPKNRGATFNSRVQSLVKAKTGRG